MGAANTPELLAPLPAPDASAGSGTEQRGGRAQAIRCAGQWVAWPHGAARKAVDRVEISALPSALPWFVGAANIDGSVVPVIDLAMWRDPSAATNPAERETRALLVGEGARAMAVLFEGLPKLVRVDAQVPTLEVGDPLARHATGTVVGDEGGVLIDAESFTDGLIEQLRAAA